jgi:hypothetical protein
VLTQAYSLACALEGVVRFDPEIVRTFAPGEAPPKVLALRPAAPAALAIPRGVDCVPGRAMLSNRGRPARPRSTPESGEDVAVASVFLKRNTWYLQVRDAAGRRRCLASAAATKTEAKRLASEKERQYERQRLGLEPAPIADGLRTVDDLLEWWIENFLKHAPSYASTIATIRKHLIGSKDVGRVGLEEISPGKIDLFLTRKERELSPQSVNHLRGFLRRAFNLGRRMEKFPRPNPVADVPKRKVPKRLPDYLRPNEVPALLAAVAPKWRALFATAIYTGLRKGELFALHKSDIDLATGLITVSRSHDRDMPKNGRSEAVPINSELLAKAPIRINLIIPLEVCWA